jgi:ABC-type sugar transport system permease subunit
MSCSCATCCWRRWSGTPLGWRHTSGRAFAASAYAAAVTMVLLLLLGVVALLQFWFLERKVHYQ